MRKKLPNTRSAVTSKVEMEGMEAYITVGFYEDNQPGEVFIKIAKEGSFLRGALDIIAIEASMLLQYGVPGSVVIEKWTHIKFDQAIIFEGLAKAFCKAVSLMGGNIDEGHSPGGGASGSPVPVPPAGPAPDAEQGAVRRVHEEVPAR